MNVNEMSTECPPGVYLVRLSLCVMYIFGIVCLCLPGWIRSPLGGR